MKYAVICKPTRQRYVCALFKSKEKAAQLILNIPSENKAKIVETYCTKFPVYIIESRNKFKFTDNYEVIEKEVSKIKYKIDFDDAYFNVYYLKKEYQSKPLGADKMGSLDHVHVDNYDIKLLSEKIKEMLFVEYFDIEYAFNKERKSFDSKGVRESSHDLYGATCHLIDEWLKVKCIKRIGTEIEHYRKTLEKHNIKALIQLNVIYDTLFIASYKHGTPAERTILKGLNASKKLFKLLRKEINYPVLNHKLFDEKN